MTRYRLSRYVNMLVAFFLDFYFKYIFLKIFHSHFGNFFCASNFATPLHEIFRSTEKHHVEIHVEFL